MSEVVIKNTIYNYALLLMVGVLAIATLIAFIGNYGHRLIYIVLWIPVTIISIFYNLLKAIYILLTDVIPLLVCELYNRCLVRLFNLPKAYSKVNLSWANKVLSKKSLNKQIYILEEIDYTTSWRLLILRPEKEVINFLKRLSHERVEKILYLENITKRKEIASKLGINLGVLKDKEDILPYA